MTTRLQFFSDLLDGATAQLWTTQSSLGGGFPIGSIGGIPMVADSDTVTGGLATFAPPPVSPFAFRVVDGDTLLMRSGPLDLTAGTVDEETGDFSIAYFIIQPTQPTVIAPTALAGLLPAVPMTTNDDNGDPEFTMNSIGLSITGNTLTATGTGVYLQTAIGGPVAFTYEFRLKPVRSPFGTDRLLKVETVRSTVVSTSGGWLGFLVDTITNIVLWIMEEDIARRIEKTVQTAIDAAIADSLASAGAGEGVTVSVMSVAMDSVTGITIDALAALNTQGLCPTEVSAGSVRLRPAAQVRALAAMRDRVLRGTPQGEGYLALFRKYRKELLWLLLRNPELLKQADAVVATGLKDFAADDPGNGVMSKATADAAARLLEMVGKLGSPELAALSRGLVADVRRFVGRPVAQVLGCKAGER